MTHTNTAAHAAGGGMETITRDGQAIPGCHRWTKPHVECGRESVYRYRAMGGGWAYLCAEHGRKHADYNERLVNGVWLPPASAPEVEHG